MFPHTLLSTVITLLIKKSSLDRDDLSSYRPVSNIQCLEKLIEKFVSKQVSTFVTHIDLLDHMQSAHESHILTKTALIRVQNDKLVAIDNGHAVFL